jgi:hypothetical protein
LVQYSKTRGNYGRLQPKPIDGGYSYVSTGERAGMYFPDDQKWYIVVQDTEGREFLVNDTDAYSIKVTGNNLRWELGRKVGVYRNDIGGGIELFEPGQDTKDDSEDIDYMCDEWNEFDNANNNNNNDNNAEVHKSVDNATTTEGMNEIDRQKDEKEKLIELYHSAKPGDALFEKRYLCPCDRHQEVERGGSSNFDNALYFDSQPNDGNIYYSVKVTDAYGRTKIKYKRAENNKK